MRKRYMKLRSQSPRSFLFYIVADVGPDRASRPLAVAYRQGSVQDDYSAIRADRVIRDIIRIMTVFSDAENRTCIEGELALAARWYQDQGDVDTTEVANRPKISDSPQPPLRPCVDEEIHMASLNPLPGLPWKVKRPEFPIVSSCVVQGLLASFGANETRLCDVQLQPLSTVFLGDCLEYGMVTIDISKLDMLRYGIVAFPVCYMADVSTGHEAYWDSAEDPWPDHEPDVVLTSERPRVLSDVHQYLWNSSTEGLNDSSSHIETLASYGLVDQAILSHIWPAPYRNPSDIDIEQRPEIAESSAQGSHSLFARVKSPSHLVPAFLSRLRDPAARRKTRLRRVDRAVDAFLLEAQRHIDHEMTTLKTLRESAEHLSCLRQKIQTKPTMLEQCQDQVQLLQIAYTGCAHLNWATFSRLSYETLAEALLSSELEMGSSLSLVAVPDREGSLSTLIDAILRSTSLKKVNLLECPGRESDDMSMHIYENLLRSVKDAGPLTKTIASAGAFSAPLCKSRSLSPGTAAALNDVVPTLRIRLNRVFTTQHHDTRLVENLWSLDDALLNPERFAIGFIRFLRNIAFNKAFLHFSCGPTTVDTKQMSQLAISPILADPFLEVTEEIEGESLSQLSVEEVPGSSWMIVLHVAEHVNMNVEPHGVHLDQTIVVQYSFLKITRDINLKDGYNTESCLSDALEVVGALKDFLSYVAPALDGARINAILERAEMDLRKDGNDTLPSNMTSIGVLPEAEALSILARKCRVPVSSSHLDHSENTV